MHTERGCRITYATRSDGRSAASIAPIGRVLRNLNTTCSIAAMNADGRNEAKHMGNISREATAFARGESRRDERERANPSERRIATVGSVCARHKIKMTEFRPSLERNSTYMRILNKFYRCAECVREGGGVIFSSNICISCYLCDQTFAWGIKNTTDIYNHNKNYHGKDFSHSFEPGNLINLGRGMSFQILDDILPNNPQFAVLVSNDKNLSRETEEFISDIYKKGPIMKYDDVLVMVELVKECSMSPLKTFACI